ncbi:MAG TPA: XamI family restriction endonuclease [Burkholderiales bacterium]|nr:XamI family restriction endonuclease [Burkholderiales bacterium]
MAPAAHNVSPRVWTEAELKEQAQIALDEFVDRRLAEPAGAYLRHVRERRSAIVRLFKILSYINPEAPDAGVIRTILSDEDLFAGLRYVAGPPLSEDDLGVLVTRDVGGLKKRAIAEDDKLPLGVLALVCRLSDPSRFPWLAAKRKPTTRELRSAIASTAALHATQTMVTERRGYGKLVEQRLETRLVEMGFVKVSGSMGNLAPAPFPKKGKISVPNDYPTFPYFFGECVVYERKVDLFIALKSGRMIALEAKDSSSALNGKKRLLNDTGGKAKAYADSAGKTIINVALLSGVFSVPDLLAAQDKGLYLVWAHHLDEFIDWIKTQT